MPKSNTAKVVSISNKPTTTSVGISPPNFQYAKVEIEGDAPYVQNKMSIRAREAMMAKQMLGDVAKKNRKREPKDFDALYKGAMHISRDGWYGMPASAFRSALISACRTVGFAMTRAKLSLFIEADGFDEDDGQPLVRIYGEPRRVDIAVRLANGMPDILPRPMFENWSAKITLKWDADQFSAQDVVNLLARVGGQVGIGAGRPDSKDSCGMGWGTFKIKT